MPAINLPTRDTGAHRRVSVLLPAYNERENLVELVPETLAVLEQAGLDHEIVVVDDGSTDGTRTTMRALESPRVRYLRLRRNAGKSEALRTGLAAIDADVVVLMDADGQDEPAEIPRLVEVLERGDADLVTGRRSVRNDRFIKRNTSKVYNAATAKVTGVPGRDFNSGLKAMTGEVARSLELYGELHRYIPVLAVWNGFAVTELDVEHHERRHGTSKFGRARFWRGFLDLITVKFLTTYTARPFHLFGGIGIILGLVGMGLLAWMLVLRITGETIGNRPALLGGVLFVVVAVQMISLGLVGELIVHLRRRTRLDAEVEMAEVSPGEAA
ncbi:MAG TPA: glycosyltransferase family 2 protein [Acidimicrobiales bacterium]|nr:glycosyltransferase family 2 protein [Acidimicrobiales bacterium]